MFWKARKGIKVDIVDICEIVRYKGNIENEKLSVTFLWSDEMMYDTNSNVWSEECDLC